MDAFDADVLIYAAAPGHPLGARVAPLLARQPQGEPVGIGSVLLLPELLAKPLREDRPNEVAGLLSLLSRLELMPVDLATAELATGLASAYRLRATDAVHLATAVNAGAARFLTNNTRDFTREIVEIEVVTPVDLPG